MGEEVWTKVKTVDSIEGWDTTVVKPSTSQILSMLCEL